MLDDARVGAGLPTTGKVEFEAQHKFVQHAARLKAANETRPQRLAYTDTGAIVDLNEADDEAARVQRTEESLRRQREDKLAERAVEAEAMRQLDEARAERARRELPDQMFPGA